MKSMSNVYRRLRGKIRKGLFGCFVRSIIFAVLPDMHTLYVIIHFTILRARHHCTRALIYKSVKILRSIQLKRKESLDESKRVHWHNHTPMNETPIADLGIG